MSATLENKVSDAKKANPSPEEKGWDPKNQNEFKSSPGQIIRPDNGFMAQVEAESGVKVSACYGCKKCSNGCPVSLAMDFHPYQVVRYVQLGLREKLLESSTIWICASCQTCLTRCPNDVDLPRLMDYLKEEVVLGHGKAREKRIKLFHELFLGEVKKYGRVFEGGLMSKFMFRSGGFMGHEAIDNARLGFEMLRRGRMNLFPHRITDRSWLAPLFPNRRPKP